VILNPSLTLVKTLEAVPPQMFESLILIILGGCMSEQGKLYLVGTPIGNLSDISPRALEVLGSVDFIAAEDTRVTLKLLSRFNIKKALISCREHNIRQKSAEIAERLMNGESCAVVTDAGMPCISDPGEELVSECAERGIEVIVIPGPSALIAALSVSGLPTERFSFEGFLSINKRSRAERLNEVKDSRATLIFYEAPHKLIYTLKDLLAALGNRKIAVCRELTKIHEEVKRGKIADLLAFYETEKPRGEFVLVVEGKTLEKLPEISISDAVESAMKLLEKGTGTSEMAKQIARQTGHKKSEIYKLINEVRK
jgi:16S rRNA (cytidine1402-2'-O)-methyltransferase